MDFFFSLSKVLTQLVMPPTSLLLLAVIALLLLNRWPRIARTTLWLSISTLFLLSMPFVADGLVTLLDAPPLDLKGAKNAQAVMILGGGIIRGSQNYGGDTVSNASLTRTRYGVKLAKELHLPILVTGGQVYGGQPEAEVMADVLATEYGVPARWIENRSRDTAENARFSAELLRVDKIRKVVLVTHAAHMRRALAHCEAAGLICYSAPLDGIGTKTDSWIQELPSVGALHTSVEALHEFLGILVLKWR